MDIVGHCLNQQLIPQLATQIAQSISIESLPMSRTRSLLPTSQFPLAQACLHGSNSTRKRPEESPLTIRFLTRFLTLLKFICLMLLMQIVDNLLSQECTDTSRLSKKWNSFCSSVDKEPYYPEKTIKFASSPPSPISISSQECNTNVNHSHLSWPVIFKPKQFPKEQKIWMPECINEDSESNLINIPKPELLSNPNSSPNSASSSEAMDDTEGLQSFKEFNDQNMKILCNSLEKKVPWQKDIIPEIVNTILECRSGNSKRKCKPNHGEAKEETWLFFLGVDSEGKEKIARELARLVFGSQANYTSIGVSNFSSTRADSTEELKNKRARDEMGSSYHDRFGLALNENPHRVFFMEDLEQVDYYSQKAIKQAIESGRVELPGGETVPLKDAIIIFSSESFSSVSRACSPLRRFKTGDESEEQNPVVSLDLNIAIEVDDHEDENSNIADNGILQIVDRQIIFKIQEM